MGKKSNTVRIYLMLTRKCNLNCRYCFEGDKSLLPANDSELSEETVDKFLINFCKDYIKNERDYFIDFQLTGGEPTLVSPDKWDKICSAIESRMASFNLDFGISMVSNGILLNDDFINVIKKHNIGLLVSLDGISDNDRADRKTNELIVKNILNLDRKCNQKTGLDVCVTSVNKDKSFEELEKYIPDINNRANKIVPVASPEVMMSAEEQYTYYHKPLLERFIAKKIVPKTREWFKFFNVRTGRYLNRFLVDILTNHTNLQECSCTGNYCGGAIKLMALWPDGTVSCCTDVRGYEKYFDGKICKAGDYSFLDLDFFRKNFELVSLISDIRVNCDVCVHDYYCERPCILKIMNNFGKMPDYVCTLHDNIYRYYIRHLKQIIDTYYDLNDHSISIIEDSAYSLKVDRIFDYDLELSEEKSYDGEIRYKKINLIKRKLN